MDGVLVGIVLGALLLCAVVFFVVRTRRAAGPASGKEPAARPADVYQGLREQVLKVSAADLGLNVGLNVAPGEPYGVLMETGYPEAVATLVSLADGTVSMYFSNGGGIIGAGAHDTVRQAAKTFIASAEKYIGRMEKAAAYPTPAVGRVRFYVLTSSGVFTAEDAENGLGNGERELSAFFHEGHRVITELRLVKPEKRR